MRGDIEWYMNPLFCLQELISKAFERKWATVLLIFLFFCSIMSGIIFVKTPYFYDYALKICDRFLDRVCYSDKNIFLIFLERSAGNIFFLALLMVGGVHPLTLFLTSTMIAYRAYAFGSTLTILFSVYKVSGAMIVITFYFPIHILLDVLFLVAASISVSRAFSFRWCTSDFKELLLDFGFLSILTILLCLLEMILLGVLFHPLGNLL